MIYSQLSRLGTARAQNIRSSLVGPNKVKICKSFVFPQKFLIVENKEHLCVHPTKFCAKNCSYK